MDVVSTCPLQVGALYWMPRENSHAMTVVCKGTFDLRTGRAQLASIQDFPNEADNHWNDDPKCSVYSPGDLAPFKRRADVMLVGEAFAPGGDPVQSLVVRVIVGSLDKAAEVYCDRHFNQQDELIFGERFTKMQLRFERAAGGSHTRNPVGIDPEGERDRYGRLAVPNVQPVGATITMRQDFVEPIGFGPIGEAWSARRKLLGRHSATWRSGSWHKSPMPQDIDGSYFNASPVDQRIDEIHEDERIVLENMHPDEPRLVTHLPGIVPIAFVEREGAVRSLSLRGDTLWIDTTRGVATVTWRAHLPLDSPRDRGRVLVGMQKHGEEVTWGDVREAAMRVGHEVSDELTGDAEPMPIEAELPFARPLAEEHTAIGVVPDEIIKGAGPAFIQGGKPAGKPQRAATRHIPQISLDDRSPAWLHQTMGSGAPLGSAPGGVSAKGKAPSAPPPPPPTGGGLPPIPAARQPLPSPTKPPAPEPTDSMDGTVGYGQLSPWARKDAAGGSSPATGSNPPPRRPSGVSPTLAGDQALAPQPVPGGSIPGVPGPSMAPSIAGPPVAAPIGRPISGHPSQPPPSPAALSPAPPMAAPPLPSAPIAPSLPGTNSPRAPNPVAQMLDVRADPTSDQPTADGRAMHDKLAARQTAHEIVELLWFDEEKIDAIREVDDWSELIEELRREAEADKADPIDFDEDPPEEEPPEVRDRRDIVAIMTRGRITTAASLPATMMDAVDASGSFEPPIVMMSGRIHLPFDELETLKATLAAVTPLIAGNKELAETVETVQELMKTPWLQEGSGDVATNLTDKIRESFKRADRVLDPSYLDDHTERILLEQRRFQQRTVLGGKFIRALLAPSSGRTKVPAYLPMPLQDELPMFKTFPTRIIAEAHVQQDQYESCQQSMKVIALGRVVQFTKAAAIH